MSKTKTTTLSRWDEQDLWEIYRRHDGNITACAEDPGGPSARNTWKKLIADYAFEKRLVDEKYEIAQIAVNHYNPARIQELEGQLETMQQALFDLLLPETIEGENGERRWKWKLAPTKFEGAARVLMQVVDKLQVLRGGVASRTEIRTVIDINLKTYHQTVATVLLEVAGEGLIPETVSREILHRVQSKLEEEDLILEAP